MMMMKEGGATLPLVRHRLRDGMTPSKTGPRLSGVGARKTQGIDRYMPQGAASCRRTKSLWHHCFEGGVARKPHLPPFQVSDALPAPPFPRLFSAASSHKSRSPLFVILFPAPITSSLSKVPRRTKQTPTINTSQTSSTDNMSLHCEYYPVLYVMLWMADGLRCWIGS
jgi:hypothetical protein